MHRQGMKCLCVQRIRVVLINAFFFIQDRCVSSGQLSKQRESANRHTHLELGWGFYVQLKLYLYVNMTVTGA